MKASIGRIVTVIGVHSNGTGTQPAIITRAWFAHDTKDGPGAVNLTVFPDAAPPVSQTSVMLYETSEEAQAHVNRSGGLAAHWPDRV